MRIASLISTVSLALLVGCAGPEEKFSRGMRNMTEITRMGEMRRSMEQSYLWEGPDVSYTSGVVRGFNRTVARTVLGAYEVATFPLPKYSPICTNYLSAKPVYPDSFKPHVIDDPIFQPDANLGFSGGDIAPMIPGSRFRLFEQ